MFRAVHKPDCSERLANMRGDGGSRSSNGRLPVEAMSSMVTKQPQLALEGNITPAVLVPACVFCGESKLKLLLCGKCKLVRYCGPDHQKQHWCVVFLLQHVL
jgi:hypothetical protein